MIEAVYSAGLHAAGLLLPLVSHGESKLARGVRGRKGSRSGLVRWSEAHRDPTRPLVWFHAPSVGEGLQARAVITALRALHPEIQIAYTFFSPSAESFAPSVGADVASYLPPDLPREVGPVLDALGPAALVFTKTEVWPNLTREAERRGIPTALLSATLTAGSSRLTWPARALLAPAHRRLAAVAAISPEDAARFGYLGVPSGRRSVMGDARFDQVWDRAHRGGRAARLPAALAGLSRPTVVAGSTWPADEERLLGAFARLARANPGARLVLVPHEPTEAHLRHSERLARAAGLQSLPLSRWAGGREPPVVLVDQVGILGDLYGLADVAYVGGGFGGAGLHSVLEPAAFGAPVLFGPRHGNAREAAELIADGGALAVADTASLERALSLLLNDAGAREAAGTAARAYIEKGLGAAERGLRIVETLLR